jgi:RNA polymerase sigma-70 factor (ECF subfamily)
MLTNLLTYRTQIKEHRMSSFRKTVSDAAIHEEWAEIQAAQRNPAMFRPLYDRYFEPIFRFVFQRTANEELSADLCSQVFLKAMQRLGAYEFKGVPFSAWLYRIAMNEVAQHYRAAQKARVVCVENGDLRDMMEEMEEELPDYHDKLPKALATLSAEDLRLIELRFFEHRPFKEIADIVGMTESNTKVKTYRILERLKRKLIV